MAELGCTDFVTCFNIVCWIFLVIFVGKSTMYAVVELLNTLNIVHEHLNNGRNTHTNSQIMYVGLNFCKQTHDTEDFMG